MKIKDTKLNIGGAFRCCLESFDTYIEQQDADHEYNEGDIIPCKWCQVYDPETSGLILHNGTWQSPIWIGLE
jgi:hypothetical protein